MVNTLQEQPYKALQLTVNIPRFSRHKSLTETEENNAEIHPSEEDESLQQRI